MVKKIKIGEDICCTNTGLYGENKIDGLHCTSKEFIGTKCAYCDGTYVKKEYWIDEDALEVKIIKKEKED